MGYRQFLPFSAAVTALKQGEHVLKLLLEPDQRPPVSPLEPQKKHLTNNELVLQSLLKSGRYFSPQVRIPQRIVMKGGMVVQNGQTNSRLRLRGKTQAKAPLTDVLRKPSLNPMHKIQFRKPLISQLLQKNNAI